MKRLTKPNAFLLFAVASMTIASCKKEYTCECISEYGTPGATSKLTTTKVIKDKKADAETECNGLDSDYSTSTLVSKSQCSIK